MKKSLFNSYKYLLFRLDFRRMKSEITIAALFYIYSLSLTLQKAHVEFYFSFGFSNRPRSADGIREGGRHVPYRNSLLTMLLRDSLGESIFYYCM